MFDFKVTPDGSQPFTVTAGSRDVLHWERTTKGASIGALTDRQTMRMTDLYKLAWIASRRLSLYGGDLKDFEATCEVETIDDEDGVAGEPDPTQPAP